MTCSLLCTAFIFLLTTFSRASALSSDDDSSKPFMQCLTSKMMSKLIYSPNNSSYTPILQISINNLRFMTSDTPKPLLIVTPIDESQIQTIIFCSKKFGMHIRIRSGGHDFEGQSYVAQVPFVLLDMTNLRSITVNMTNKTAWVESGATIGELYCRISEESDTLGFPGGLWTNVGIGGFISGGGYGMMRRKYGLAADNVLDVRFINVNGTIHNRKTMGEDLFWAIRGGGGSSFGVIHSWKIKLVPVPKVVTVFRTVRTLEQNATDIFYRWQDVAPRFPKNLDLKCYVQSILSNASTREDGKTIKITFESLYLGPIDQLLILIRERFPELGLKTEDCSEISWIESGPFFSNHTVGTSPDIMLNRSALPKFNFKGKSDFARNIIPKDGIMGIWEMLFNVAPEAALLQFTPFGGRMNEISESAIPFPHRAGTLYMIYMGVFLDTDASQRLKWINSMHEYLTPYVSKNPRAAYVNYLDLDLGNNTYNERSSYVKASNWGRRYFKNNFRKLMQVKTVADPDNFFRHEQSIPTLS
ncbi:Berberine bridge enzyme [Heracleum sosnowskyi]|uniref:Berberine bridge enzyme n=1 Tax=Heracleum sosnowskyi TaxID=360622 RepID=A0AAD8HGP6_9APIA|nr:Berberine bridge enzyme [Heracleum sosnowskyi]